MARDADDAIKKRVKELRDRIWVVFLIAAIPLSTIVIADALVEPTQEQMVRRITFFLFGLGLSITVARVAKNNIVNRRLKQIDEIEDAKTEFLAIASHQLKSPVSSLNWQLEAMKMIVQDKDWEKLEQELEDLGGTVKRLSDNTEQLLNATVINAGKLESQLEKVNLSDIIAQTVEDMEPVAEVEDLGIIYSNVDDDITVMADKTLFANVVQNLISNAIKYSEEKTNIEILQNRTAGAVEFTVQNVAKNPVSAADLNNFFTKFHRRQVDREGPSVGTGLGLYIVKSYVEHWGGSIKVHAKSEKLIAFTFTVPIRD